MKSTTGASQWDNRLITKYVIIIALIVEVSFTDTQDDQQSRSERREETEYVFTPNIVIKHLDDQN